MKWWAYLHTSGTIQLKRFFDHRDFEDADESPFVVRRTGHFEAEDRADAMAKAKKELFR